MVGSVSPGFLSEASESLSSTALNPPSLAASETLFSKLPESRTGIVVTNDFDDPSMWRQLYREYALGAIGTGVAIGDYDKDGLADVYIVSKLDTGRLFRNLGDFRFEDVTEAAGLVDASGAWKQGAAFVDVNNDGFLDLHVCRSRAANLLYLNRGDGRFEEVGQERGLAVVDGSGMACFADYDRDGWLDMYLQTNLMDSVASPDGQRDRLFRNEGHGYFREVTEEAGILGTLTQGHSATWWDFDEDGWQDLYVANDFGPPDFLYRNNGDGTFTNVLDETVPHTSFSSMGADLGDVNNDGHIDFFVSDMAGSTLEKEHRGQSDSRALLDARRNESKGTALQLLKNALYENSGKGRFYEAAILAGISATDWTWSTRFEDLDNDGRLDLFVTNGMDREQNNLDLIEKRMASVNAWGRIGILKASPVLEQANFAFANRGDLQFEEVGEQWGLHEKGVSFGAAFGDLDNDGDLDLVYTNYEAGPTVLRNDSQAGQRVIVLLKGVHSNRFGLGARIELVSESGLQVRELVSARGYLSTSETIAHFGLGEDQGIESLTVHWPSGIEQRYEGLAAGFRYTIEEEGEPVLGARSKAAAPVRFREVSEQIGLSLAQEEEVLEGTVAQALLPKRFNRRGPGLAVEDLDGDGLDEILLGATAKSGAKVLKLSEGEYRIMDTGPLGEAPPINDGPPLIFDANGDGLNDILFTGGGAALPAEEPEYEPRLWLNAGARGFMRAKEGILPSTPISAGAVVSADFDRDGALDLFIGGRLFPGYYPEPAYSALLMRKGDAFEDATDSLAPGLAEVGLVTSALASDVDGDGWTDLVVALEWGGVRVFRNEAGRSFADVSEKWGFDNAGHGLWTSLASGDFNGDGILDYALGNHGLNTIYSQWGEGALNLFYGRFSRSSELMTLLAYEREGAYYPLASRGELMAKIPEVRSRFPSNDDFARASLAEIVGEEALAGASVFSAEELRSGVLLSGGADGYAFEPLPRVAQLAPVQGMQAGDFDLDGHCDLLLVQNDFSAIPAHGRFDSGLGGFFRGDGSGAFEFVPATSSGWLVAGNAKALVKIDFDGDAVPDAVGTRNDDRSFAFRNEIPSDRLCFALRLQGKGGNGNGVGARVSVLCDGQLSWLEEVQAGGGYASQSAALVYFSVPREALESAELLVRWPSGGSSRHELPREAGYFSIQE
ncbi:VCBS repeat-containing protein [Pelagicoccus sp. NFK12]|uniref:VCBS repeat-containing protein n=1 Tax=Pelagicoccus enzymogenes TaxID=2773457 RepID=A0A927IFW5_9BACT|nr:VCBS repeat-containing protein [Pelagicoccus enzymogenes]